MSVSDQSRYSLATAIAAFKGCVLPRVLQQPDLRSLTGTAAGYSSAVVNTDRYRWLTVDVVSW